MMTEALKKKNSNSLRCFFSSFIPLPSSEGQCGIYSEDIQGPGWEKININFPHIACAELGFMATCSCTLKQGLP